MNDLELNHFDGIIGLLSGLNLAYAGSDTFRTILDERILRLSTSISAFIINAKTKAQQELLGASVLMNFEKGGESNPILEEHNKTILFLITEHEEYIKKVEEEAKSEVVYPKSTKSIFLYTLFYGVGLFILSGYQKIILPETFNKIIFLLNFSIVYSLFVFARTFTKYRGKPIKPMIAIFIFIVVYASVFIIEKTVPINTPTPLSVNIGMCIFVAASPYLLHFLRLLIHRVIFKCKIWRSAFNCIYDIKKVNGVSTILSRRNEFLKTQ